MVHTLVNTFVYQKNFPLTEIIDYHLQKFKESGLLQRLEKKYFKKLVQDCNPVVREMTFKATFLTFAILSVGIGASLLAFAVEKMKRSSTG
jgi:hypothetical protein